MPSFLKLLWHTVSCAAAGVPKLQRNWIARRPYYLPYISWCDFLRLTFGLKNQDLLHFTVNFSIYAFVNFHPFGLITKLKPFITSSLQKDFFYSTLDIINRLGIVVTLLSRQFWNKDNNCHKKRMETIKIIKIFEIILPEKHN